MSATGARRAVDAVAIGLIVRRARLQRRMHQSELAGLVGFSRPWVSMIERGEFRRLDSDTLARLAATLGLDPAALLGEAHDRRASAPSPAIASPPAPVKEYPEGIPVVGDASAGEGAPILGYEFVGHSRTVGHHLLGVRVRGSCMAPMIEDGDVVIYDASQVEPRNGELVVATVTSATSEAGDGVVKRWYRTPGGIELVPNVGATIRVTPEDVIVHGIVVEIRRQVPRVS